MSANQRALELLRQAAAALDGRQGDATPGNLTRAAATPSTSNAAELPLNTIAASVRNIFAPYRGCGTGRSFHGGRGLGRGRAKPVKYWSHKFCLLAKSSDEYVPDLAYRDKLNKAGLGEKRLSFQRSDDPIQFKQTLEEAYTKLKGVQGLELLRSSIHTRTELELMQMPVNGFSSNYLIHRSHLGQAVCYVRPIQEDISLDVELLTEEDGITEHGITEQCKSCHQHILLKRLREHTQTCGLQAWSADTDAPPKEELASDQPAQNNSGPAAKRPRNDPVQRPVCQFACLQDSNSRPRAFTEGCQVRTPTERGSYRTYIDLCDEGQVESSSEDEDTRQAIEASLREEQPSIPQTTLEAELTIMASKIKTETPSYFNVNRRKPWDGAKRGFLRKSFCPKNRISVKFTDDIGQAEGAADVGGPNREFLRLLMDHIRTSEVFIGAFDCKMLCLNQRASTEDLYHLIGTMISVSIVHGGPGPRCFSEKFYQLITQKQSRTIQWQLQDLQDGDIKEKLEKIENATSYEEMLGAADSASDILDVAGCIGTVLKDLHAGKDLVRAATRFFVFERIADPLQRFKDGLTTLGMLNSVQQYPGLYKDLFCARAEPLSAHEVENLFRIQPLSEDGSNRRTADEDVIGWWREFVIDVEEKQVPYEVTFQDLLIFSTGASEVPPMGFVPPPSVTFLHGNDGKASSFPKGQTCSNELQLPVCHSTYEVFPEKMAFGIANTQGFGLI